MTESPKKLPCCAWLGIIAILALVAESEVFGQESIRPSLTGAEAAEARLPAFHVQPNYNLKAGPISFDLTGALGLEFNDNINLAEHGRKADLIIRPEISLNSFWQITKFNALTLDIGIAYAKYVNNQGLDTNSALIAPNSQLSFDVFVGDFRINFHDRIAISEDPINQITLSNTADFTHLENSAGLSVLWDLNDIKIVLGYDYYLFRDLSNGFHFLDRTEHQFTLSTSFRISDEINAGFDAGFALVDYKQNFNNDAVSYHVGPFYEQQVSNYLKLRLSGGYQAINFDSGGTNTDSTDASGPFAVATISHRLNNYITENLTAGYETQLGLTTNFVELGYVRYDANWRVNRRITLRLNGFYEHAHESAGVLPENAQRFGAGFGFGYQLTKKCNIGIQYQFTLKDSDLVERSYYQNQVLLRVAYDF